MKFGIGFVCTYCGLWIGIGLSAVDQVPTCSQEPFGYSIPITIALGFCLPIVLAFCIGVQAGRESK